LNINTIYLHLNSFTLLGKRSGFISWIGAWPYRFHAVSCLKDVINYLTFQTDKITLNYLMKSNNPTLPPLTKKRRIKLPLFTKDRSGEVINKAST